MCLSQFAKGRCLEVWIQQSSALACHYVHSCGSTAVNSEFVMNHLYKNGKKEKGEKILSYKALLSLKATKLDNQVLQHSPVLHKIKINHKRGILK